MLMLLPAGTFENDKSQLRIGVKALFFPTTLKGEKGSSPMTTGRWQMAAVILKGRGWRQELLAALLLALVLWLQLAAVPHLG